MGHPFFANPQHAILYPINWLFFLLPFDIAFNIIIVLHFFLGGLFVYFLLRDMEVSQSGSLISGLIFMLSGYLLSLHSLLTILLSVIWTPLIIMFFKRTINHPGIKNEILVGIFMTVSFFGGGIEIVYGNFIVLFIMIIFSIGSPSLSSSLKSLFIRIRSLFFIFFVFFILSSIQLIPFFELWIYSIRGEGISYQEATIWSFSPKDFLLFFLPDAYGYFIDIKKYWVTQCWLKTLYTGGLPFIFSFIFFLFQTPKFLKDKKLYLFLMLFSLFLSFGKYNPLYPLVYQYLPFFNGIRYPVKFLYIFILCISITAGLGYERLVELSKKGNKRLNKYFLIFAIISGFILILFILGHKEIETFLKHKGIDFPNFNNLSVNLFHVKRFLFYLTIFFLIIRIGLEFGLKNWVSIMIILFLIGDLFGNMGFYGKERTHEYFRKTKIFEIVSQEKGMFRVFSTPKTTALETPIMIGNPTPFDLIKEKHLPSFNLLYKIHGVWGIDVLRPKRIDELYQLWISASSIRENNLVDLLGAKYIVSINPIEGDKNFELIYARLEGLIGDREKLLQEPTIKLYKNHNSLPRAWLVKEFKVMNEKEIIAMLIDKRFKPKDVVLLEEAPNFPSIDSGGEVGLIKETNNRLLLRVKLDHDGVLVLTDSYFPGWRVLVNQKREKILRANYNFKAVALKAGINNIEFVYAPFSFKLGLLISLLGIIFLIWRLCFYRLNPNRNKPS